MIKQRKPIESLMAYIDELWYVDEAVTVMSDIIMPTGQIHIVFNLGDSYKLVADGHEFSPPDYALFGQFKDPVEVKYGGHHIRQLGIAFRPSDFLMFFGTSHSLCLNTIVDCNSLTDHSLMSELVGIAKKVHNGKEINGFDSIESLFLNYVCKDTKIKLLDSMIAFIEKRKGNIDIKEMAKTFGYSISAIERLFRKYFGLTPKAYSEIIRFKQSVISEDPQTFFYDQSHFIKSCKKYTLKTPKELGRVSEITLKHMLKELP